VSSFTLRFADGSHGTVHYLANGHKGFPKERLEVFAGGRVLQLDNYRRLRAWGWKGGWGAIVPAGQGEAACAAAFLSAVREGRPSPIPFEEIMEVSRVSVELAEAARPGDPAVILKQLGLYARTLYGLRPVQWAYLPLRRLQARLPARVPEPPVRLAGAKLAPAGPTDRRGPAGGSGGAGGGASSAGEFTFLGHTERIAEPTGTERYVSHLWSYNLHYFDYARDLAWARPRDGRGALRRRLRAWRSPGCGAPSRARGDGWEPYAVSLRVVNWLYALSLLGDAVEPDARPRSREASAGSSAWLERRLEKHIQANHLQKNFWRWPWGALLRGGGGRAVAPEGSGMWQARASRCWRTAVHYERSPMYHAIALGTSWS
jgi:hypothetical protein